MIRGLYAIADAGFGDPVPLGHALIAGGARALQLRCKGWPAERVAEAAAQLRPICRLRGVPLILNDHLALAEAGLADGVHLGQEDGPFDRARLPPGCLVGRSTHDAAQLHAAVAEGADYVGFGPVFATATKDAGAARGLEALWQIAAISPLPVVAIGGVTLANLRDVQATGAPAWAVISAILRASDVAAAARRFGG